MDGKNPDLAALVRNRGQIKGALTRISNFVSNYGRTADKYNLEARHNTFRTLFEKFDKVQSEIEMNSSQADVAVQEAERQRFEDEYFSIEASFYELFENFKNVSDVNLDRALHSSVGTASRDNFRLPKIHLPTFDGNITEYRSFIDSFDSLIHGNTELSDINKLHYLKSVLKGSALKIINSLAMTDANYGEARRLLQSRYENRRCIVQAHLGLLFDQENIKSRSSFSLNKLMDTTNKHLAALKGLGENVDQWDTVLLYHILNKLDYETRCDFELHHAQKEDITFKDLMLFIQARCQAFERVECQKSKKKDPVSFVNTSDSLEKKTSQKCYNCKEDHPLFRCNGFLELTIQQRFELVKKLGICLNCFSNKHLAKECKSRGCLKCSRKHNSLLHFEKIEHSKVDQSETVSSLISGMNSRRLSTGLVLLYTAIILVRDKSGVLVPCRALVDTGSQTCFITASCVKKLSLPTKVVNIGFQGIGLSDGKTNRLVDLNINSRTETFSYFTQALVVPQITGNMPQFSLNDSSYREFSDLNLADPFYFESRKIDMLLSNSVFGEILKRDTNIVKIGNLRALNTKLGWIIGGDADLSSSTTSLVSSFLVTSESESPSVDLERLWKLEEIIQPSKRSADSCEEIFHSTLDRDDDGRFVVELPFRTDKFDFSKSMSLALHRFHQLEKRFNRNTNFKRLYCEFMQENINNGLCELVSTSEKDNSSCFYLPHHGVVKESSVTTKLRVVFDGSASTVEGQSLNSVLYTGPKEHADLFKLILQFRSYAVAIVADIEKMFCQIRIKDCYRNFLRFFWRFDAEEELKTYRLSTLPFGLRSSPFIAIKCLKELAKDFSNEYPEACELIANNFYVDDLIAGSDDVEKTIQLIEQIRKICSSAGFNLRKWMSNERKVLETLEGIKDGNILHFLSSDKHSKVLGILWTQEKDNLSFEFKIKVDDVLTKRRLLSQLAGIFDPLGWLSPVVLVGKVILQELWLKKVDWDDELSMDIRNRWNKIVTNFHMLENIGFPRYFGNPAESYLCGFSDASIKAYGAVVYLVNKKVSLVASKSRVAPLKTVSLPKLELCGAVLCARLIKCISEVLKIPIHNCFCWSDSSVVLAWLRKPGHCWKTFVSNRVSEIHSLIPEVNWNHIKSEENPADVLSRGATPAQLIEHSLWWNGPGILKDFKVVKKVNNDFDTDLEKRKVKPVVCCLSNVVECNYSRISNFSLLVSVHTWVLRFIYNSKLENKTKKREDLTVDEKNNALMDLVMRIQRHHFLNTMIRLRKNLPLKKNDPLSSLAPFLDDKGVLRVGGRLQNSMISYNVKHPIILPKKDRLVELLIRHEHFKNKHIGVNAVVAIIRQKFWIVNAKSVVKNVLNKCIICFRYLPRRTDQLLGSLPKERVEAVRPFYNVGVDFCGPFAARPTRRRGNVTVKIYVALFICFGTKAVHLETVFDLSSDAFIAALRRFIARRGRPSIIFSDNGTNFVGASNCISEWFKKECAKEFIRWKFIPPRSPNFGGLWESHIKSMKSCLIKEMGDNRLTFEEFNTLLVQIEAVLNSRPLCTISDAKDERDVLTPGHFLIGTNINGISDNANEEWKGSLNSRWKYLQKVFVQYWERWSRDYLGSLNQRSKWKNKKENLKIGDIGLLIDENTPPFRWPLCIVVNTYPGADGMVRVIEVRMNGKIFKRGVTKFCKIPDFH